jgi:hypothetical protein
MQAIKLQIALSLRNAEWVVEINMKE